VESSKLAVNISSRIETDFRERYNIYLRTKNNEYSINILDSTNWRMKEKSLTSKL